MDHLQTLGELGLGSRLKRLSDMFMIDVKKAYTAEGYDFEPRWFPLFSLLLRQGPTTVSAAAEQLQITHPHVSQIAKEMAERKLIVSRPRENDARSRDLDLTARGRKLAETVKPLWTDIQNAAHRVVAAVDARFLETLSEVERSLTAANFESRIRAERRARVLKEAEILEYTPALKGDFERLNREWIEDLFAVEPHDLRYFRNPDKEILTKGGSIFFLRVEGKIVGTCSLLVAGQSYELAKLAVTKSYKGYGFGEMLCIAVIERARKLGAKSLFLTTNTRLIPAIRLYEKLGFIETERGQHPLYKRVDLTMTKSLKP